MENDELSGNKTARKDDVPNPDTRPEITFGLSRTQWPKLSLKDHSCSAQGSPFRPTHVRKPRTACQGHSAECATPLGGAAHGKADDLTSEVEAVAGILGVHVEERVLLAALHEMRVRHGHEMLVDFFVEVHGFVDGDVSMGRAPVHVRRGSWRRACCPLGPHEML